MYQMKMVQKQIPFGLKQKENRLDSSIFYNQIRELFFFCLIK